MKYLIGLDLGTTAIKTGLIDETGKTVASNTQEYELLKPYPQWVEQDINVYWEAFTASLKAVLEKAGIEREKIVGLSISAQGETLVPIDREGKPLRKAIVWMDNRAQEEAEELRDQFTDPVIHRVTGQVSMLAMWPAAKILWLKHHQPEVYNNTYKYLLLEDYFLFRFTGHFMAEGSLLCSTIYWDINTKQYWKEMLDYLGVREEQLPEIMESGDVAGNLKADTAAELGLSENLTVVVGALDQACGAIGVGNVEPGIFTESTGAALAICAMSDKPLFDPNRQMPCFYSGIKDMYMIHTFTTGGMINRWFRDTFCQQELSQEESTGISAYDRMGQAASKVAPGCDGLILLPHFQGSGPPESNQYAKGVFFGITTMHTKAHFERAVLEAVAMTLRGMVEATENMGVSVKEIRSLSGGAKSPIWCQIKADITGRRIVTMKNTEDAACLGAAFLAGTAIGIWPSVADAAKSVTEQARVFEPDPQKHEIYEKTYKMYCHLTELMTAVFKKSE